MKVYLATPMNGKTIDEIKTKIADCASELAKIGLDFYNPFLELVAKDNSVGGIVRDHKPIEMLCNSAKNIEDCDAILFIGKIKDLKKSRGCQVEVLIAVNYDKACYLYDEKEITKLDSLKMTWEISDQVNKEELQNGIRTL